MNRITLKEWIEIMSEKYDINMDDTGYITHKNNYYYFSADGKGYAVQFFDANFGKPGFFSVKFGPEKNGKIYSTDMIGGLKMSVKKSIMTDVAKSIVLFIRRYKPIAIHYNADRDSRHKAYLHLINILLKRKEVMDYHYDNIESDFFIIRSDNDIESIFE